MTDIVKRDNSNRTLVTKEFADSVNMYFDNIRKIPTPQEYIKFKDKFAYLESKYVDDTFQKVFPVNSEQILYRNEDSYWIIYTVRITVVLPGGINISKVGSGGSRKQVSRPAKELFEKEGKPITPFDYVDVANNDKAALTLAKKNCQERFGIGADITDRIILSKEDLDSLNSAIDTIITKYIINPVAQSKSKSQRGSCKTVSDKLKFLASLRELYPESEELFIKE